ncbi:peptidoglycan-binding domain-containing protein [Nakamurella sp. A5-74]|uniref:Peptidoglycan-binding domain-containing protein n=1 Tax=Nakamurella sp. A5-74 TaxID=3158264 RepID=A0AAU8DN93_9ACTN
MNGAAPGGVAPSHCAERKPVIAADQSGPRRYRAVIGWLALTLAVGGAAFWAGTTVSRPEVDPLDQPTASLYTVVAGQVGRAVDVSVTVSWPSGRPVVSAATGTVTTVNVRSGEMVKAGDQLVSVDLQPSFAAVGTVPAFRDIGPGVRGADVEQLQQMLNTLGYPVTVTGVHDAPSMAAARRWQKAVGIPGNGIVRRGQVTFTPTLPVRIVVPEDLTVGSQVSAGSPVATIVTGEPKFTIALASQQTALIPQDGQVLIKHGATTWEGVVSSSAEDRENGGVLWTVTDKAGKPVCGSDCDSLPVPGPTTVQGSVVVVPPTQGPVVPVASILGGPAGSAAVVLADGTQRAVTVLATSGGLSVVTGINPGQQIQLFGDTGS